MKVIFPDIDGVLNVIPQGHDEFGGIFHKHFEDNLKYIINETGAKLVISSTWRYSGIDFLKNMWKSRNLAGEIIDITPDLSSLKKHGTLEYYGSVIRGEEIQSWLDNHTIKNYVIIDDDKDMLDSQLDNFVMCSENKDHEDCIDIGYGLTKKCAEQAIKILNN